VVKHVDVAALLSPHYSLPPKPRSSHTTSENLVPI
jgi:hypothetical protein